MRLVIIGACGRMGEAIARLSLERDDIELVAANQIDEAYERMLKSDVRYRFVIDMATL